MPDSSLPTHLDLTVGEERAITLPSTGVSGYIWQATIEGSTSSISARVRRGLPPGSPSLPIGQAAAETLHIQALSPGQAAVNLDLRRPWERDVEPQQSLKITVTVEGNATQS